MMMTISEKPILPRLIERKNKQKNFCKHSAEISAFLRRKLFSENLVKLKRSFRRAKRSESRAKTERKPLILLESGESGVFFNI